jgi:hypothetical protein
VLYRKTSPVVKQQWINLDYMKRKKDMHFNRILEACEFHDISDLMTFRDNWNQEVIRKRIFMWMTNDRRFHIKLT